MKMTKKFLSVLMALITIISIIPMSSITASAASTVNEATFLTRLADVKSRFRQGEYFSGNDGTGRNLTQTSATLICTGTNKEGSTCVAKGYCAGGGWCTCKCGTYYSGGIARCWQCWGFACQVGFDIFGVDSYAGWSKHKNASNIKAGDIVRFSWNTGYAPHSVFVLKVENGTVHYADCNASGPCKVNWNNSMSVSKIQTLLNNRSESEFAVYHAPNSAVSANPSSSIPTPPINFVTGLAGNYYLESKSNGYWLAVSEGKDASTQPINTWGNWGTDFRINLTAVGNGYKMKFPEISSLLVNPYSYTPTVGTKINLYKDENDITQQWGFEKVGDAYAIRCMYNTSLCLTSNGTAQATLTTYTGASNQLWYLHPYSYTVSYNANGGSGAPGSQTKYFGENLTLSSTKPTRSGYTFAGWGTSSGDTSVDYSAGGTYKKNSSITLYAIWTPNTYTVSYNANGGTGAPSSQTKTHGTTLRLSSTVPARSGYTFLGWSTNSSATSATYSPGSNFTSNANTTLYAIWTPNTYTVSYNANGGTGAPSSQIKRHDETITLSYNIPTRSGYTFLGWSTSSTATTATYSAGGSFTTNANTTLYAVWQKNAVTVSSISIATKPTKTEYYVGDSFDSNGLTIKATMSDGTTQTITSGFTVSKPDMTTSGTKTVTVTYSGKTATFTIVVNEKPVTPEIPDADCTISIRTPSTTTIRYMDGIVLHADIEGELPEGASVLWYVSNDNFEGGYFDDGMSCLFVSENNGYTTIYAVIEDANGNALAVDSIELRSNAGFFQKIGGFFRALFGNTTIYEY